MICNLISVAFTVAPALDFCIGAACNQYAKENNGRYAKQSFHYPSTNYSKL
jgi:hypothetical protein